MTIEERARGAGASLRAATEPELDVMQALYDIKNASRRRQRNGRIAGLAIAAAVGVVVSLGVPHLLTDGASQPPATGGPSVSSSGPQELPTTGALDAGTYRVSSAAGDVIVTVPTGWRTAPLVLQGGTGRLTTGMALDFTTISGLFKDPCDTPRGALSPPIGPTVDDLVRALSGSPLHAHPDGAVTVDGYHGQRVRITVPASLTDCTAGIYSMWIDGEGYHRWTPYSKERDELWILDVDGVRLVIDSVWFSRTAATDLLALDQVRQSIRIHAAHR